MNEGTKNFDLEERLVDFAVMAIKISESLNKTEVAKIVNSHLLRSAASSALHYGEVKDAESRSDFIELILKGNQECNELISIFVKSIETARKNNQSKK